MGLFDEYLAVDADYKAKYGADTALLMQCGDFFELYAVDNATETVGAAIFAVGDICNLQVTRKNKSIIENSRSNPLMAGFPLAALSKNVSALVAAGYTVVVMKQVTPPPNVTRAVTEVYSPSMTLAPASPESQYLMAFYCEPGAIGAAGVEVSTGHCFVREWAAGAAGAGAGDEVVRLLAAWNPKEVAVYGSSGESGAGIDRLCSMGAPSAKVHFRWGDYEKKLHRPAIQNGLLARTYPQDTVGCVLTAIEALNLERMDAGRMAFVLVLQFAYEHNDKIIQFLKPPQVLESEQHLALEYTSAVQLNLLGGGGADKPLVALLNKCGTPFGKRLFRERLMNPVVDTAVMTARWDKISRLIETKAYDTLHRPLSQMLDLERMLRRIQLGSFPPCDWGGLHTSLEAAEQVAGAADGTGRTGEELLAAVREAYEPFLEMDECLKYLTSDIRTNIFKKGVRPELDALQAGLSQHFETLQQYCDLISGSKVDSNDRDGYFLSITKRRWEAVDAGFRARFIAKPISNSSSVLRVSNDTIVGISDGILKTQRQIVAAAEDAYREFLRVFSEQAAARFAELIDVLADLDVAVASARNAAEWGYVRPRLLSGTEDGAYLSAKGLRHPIIERIQDRAVPYVPNDIELGVGAGARAPTGLLLYGINAAGKSSLMKAIGLNIVMAQAGMFAAAADFSFVPFRKLFTRIQMNDNIYRGMSSFTVEMTELRNILARADPWSLVLGDELCAGTESVSATAIVAAGLESLVWRRSVFVFATHLHELVGLPAVEARVKEGAIRVGHMAVEISGDGAIVYDRHIREGSGSALYGLEVCRGLGMDPDFLRAADAVRRHMLGVPAKLAAGLRVSAYNSAVVMDKCGVCGEEAAAETHHIRYQCEAAAGGDPTIHQASNLVPLCEACHKKEHRGDIKIRGWKATTEGPKLDVGVPEREATAAAPTAAAADLASWLKYDHGVWWVRAKTRWSKKSESDVRALLVKRGIMTDIHGELPSLT